MIKILMVDDHPVLMDGLQGLLEVVSKDIIVVGKATKAEKALELIQMLMPDLVLLDVSMGSHVINGLDFAGVLIRKFSELNILMFSGYSSKEYVSCAVKAGAKGYVLKESPVDEIIAAIRIVAMGSYYYTGSIAQDLLSDSIKSTALEVSSLTNREKEVLLCLVQGHGNHAIAVQLGISERTIQTHRFNLQNKLGIYDLAGLLKYAMRQGWVVL